MKKQKQVGMWIGIDEAVGKKYLNKRDQTCLISPYSNRKQRLYSFNLFKLQFQSRMRMSIPHLEMTYRDISICIDDAIIQSGRLILIEEGFT